MKTRTLYLATLTALLAACGSVPERNNSLEAARNHFDAAQRDPQVASQAPAELQRASQSMLLADQAWRNGDNTNNVNHLAYMAYQRVSIAQETAANKNAQAITAGAAAERDKLRLAVRTNEADNAKQDALTAQQKLAVSQQSNAQKTDELAMAEVAALRDRDLLAFRAAKLNEMQMQMQALNAKQTDRGMVVTLGDVLFETGKARVMPASATDMSKLADFFKRNPERKAVIEGYTDSVGNDNFNRDLSRRRANAVMSELVHLGVAPGRLSTQAFGEERPVADNASATGRQLNRRVEIVFSQPADSVVVK